MSGKQGVRVSYASIAVALLGGWSCIADLHPRPGPPSGAGWKGIYATSDSLHVVGVSDPPRDGLGRRENLAFAGLTLVLDSLRGFAVFTGVRGTGDSVYEGYVRVPGMRGFAELDAQANTVTVDNLGDLVRIDLTDPSAPRVVARDTGAATAFAFPDAADLPPRNAPEVFVEFGFDYPEGLRYFECPDPSRGVFLGWRVGYLAPPECTRL